MIVTCPDCGSEYRVNDGVFNKGGRLVRCSRCSCEWYQVGQAAEFSETAQDNAAGGFVDASEKSQKIQYSNIEKQGQAAPNLSESVTADPMAAVSSVALKATPKAVQSHLQAEWPAAAHGVQAPSWRADSIAFESHSEQPTSRSLNADSVKQEHCESVYASKNQKIPPKQPKQYSSAARPADRPEKNPLDISPNLEAAAQSQAVNTAFNRWDDMALHHPSNAKQAQNTRLFGPRQEEMAKQYHSDSQQPEISDDFSLKADQFWSNETGEPVNIYSRVGITPQRFESKRKRNFTQRAARQLRHHFDAMRYRADQATLSSKIFAGLAVLLLVGITAYHIGPKSGDNGSDILASFRHQVDTLIATSRVKDGVVFVESKYDLVQRKEALALEVWGVIANNGPDVALTPTIEIISRSENGKALQRWLAEPEHSRIEPGKTSRFTARMMNPVGPVYDVDLYIANQ